MDQDPNTCNRVPWIHLLFRGDGSDAANQTDDYERQFRAKDAVGLTIPILEFSYSNIETLGKHLCDMVHKKSIDRTIMNGMIITSPRVVEALRMAFDLISDKHALMGAFDRDYVYVVGQNTLQACENKLHMFCNRESADSGNGKNLTSFIEDNVSRLPEKAKLSLLYPKSSLADSLFEETLSRYQGLHITSIVVYRTGVVRDMASVVSKKLRAFSVDNFRCQSSTIICNLVFFSPSGVRGYLEAREDLVTSISSAYPGFDIKLRYSSIGTTTRLSLEQNELPVFCSAEKPTAVSLVDSIQHKIRFPTSEN